MGEQQMQKSLIAFLVLVFQVFCVKDASFCSMPQPENIHEAIITPVMYFDSEQKEVQSGNMYTLLTDNSTNNYKYCDILADEVDPGTNQKIKAHLYLPTSTSVHSYNALEKIEVSTFFCARIADPARVEQICTFLKVQPEQIPNDFSFTIARTSGLFDIDGNPLAMRFPWEYLDQYLANPDNCKAGYNVTANVALIDANGDMTNPNVSGEYSMHPTEQGCLTVSPNNGHLSINKDISTAVISSATWANGPISGQTRLSVILLLNDADADSLFNPLYNSVIITYGDLLNTLNALPSGLMGAQDGILKNIWFSSRLG